MARSTRSFTVGLAAPSAFAASLRCIASDSVMSMSRRDVEVGSFRLALHGPRGDRPRMGESSLRRWPAPCKTTAARTSALWISPETLTAARSIPRSSASRRAKGEA